MIRRILFAAAACASIPAILGPQPAHAAVAAPANRTIQMAHISVEVTGQGTPVILIPGLASPRAVWEAFVPELARRHRVYLVQVNGFGGDDPGANLKPGVLAGIVADLDTLIAREKLQGAALVGHSMGGLVSLMLAKAHPGDVGKLMIVDSLPFFAVLMAPPGTEVTVAAIEPRAAMMRDMVVSRYGKPADPSAAEAGTAGLALKPESKAKLTAWALLADPRVTGQAMYEDLTTDLRADLPAIRTPITLVYPWNDGGPTKAQADPYYRRQYAGAPNISYVDIGDAAHFVMLDQPEAFRVALAAFLGDGAK
jgi:pimeloyl-ACP methyl ester carboxylesterase